jgi:hypothetical protein
MTKRQTAIIRPLDVRSGTAMANDERVIAGRPSRTDSFIVRHSSSPPPLQERHNFGSIRPTDLGVG